MSLEELGLASTVYAWAVMCPMVMTDARLLPSIKPSSQTTEHFSKALHSFCCRRNELESKLLEPAVFRAGGIRGPLVEVALNQIWGVWVHWSREGLGVASMWHQRPRGSVTVGRLRLELHGFWVSPFFHVFWPEEPQLSASPWANLNLLVVSP